MRKIAIVVGHNEKRPGFLATHPIARSEYWFNWDVAKLMKEEIAGNQNYEMELFGRTNSAFGVTHEIKQCYKKVNNWKPDMCFELHFNAFDGSARGTEMLYIGAVNAAKHISAFVSNALATRDRGAKYTHEGERGYLSLINCRAPCIVMEPFFGDNEEDREKVHALGMRQYAKILLNSITSYLKP